MIIYVDVDNTICKTEGTNYEQSEPIHDRIKSINALYNEGHTIVYWTARGTLSGIDYTSLTHEQLRKWGALFHEIKLGKPAYDLFIDDKNINSEMFFNNKMSMITELKNKYEGKDIYVIGSGKTLDFMDMSFFDNKITIGVNRVFKKIKTTFLVRKENYMLIDDIKNNPHTIHVVSEGNYGQKNTMNVHTIKAHNLTQFAKVYVFSHLQNVETIQELPADENKLVVSYSTITSAIHLAAYMGAKNIIIVGHDCGTLNGEPCFTGYHTNQTRAQKSEQEYIQWLKQIESHTITLKKKLQDKYGCNVMSLNPFINFNLEGNIFKS